MARKANRRERLSARQQKGVKIKASPGTDSAAPDQIRAGAFCFFAGQLFKQHQTQSKRRAGKETEQGLHIHCWRFLLNLEALAAVEATFHRAHRNLPISDDAVADKALQRITETSATTNKVRA